MGGWALGQALYEHRHSGLTAASSLRIWGVGEKEKEQRKIWDPPESQLPWGHLDKNK